MSRLLRTLFLLVSLAPLASEARILDNTSGLSPGHLSFGAEFQALIAAPNPLAINFHERIGLASGLGLYLIQGVVITEQRGVRLGGGVKWTLLRDAPKNPGLAWWLGGFYLTNADRAGFATTFMIDHAFGRVTPLAAMDLDLIFNDGVDARFTLIGGLRIALARALGLFVEAGVGLTGRAKNHFVSTGLRVSL